MKKVIIYFLIFCLLVTLLYLFNHLKLVLAHSYTEGFSMVNPGSLTVSQKNNIKNNIKTVLMTVVDKYITDFCGVNTPIHVAGVTYLNKKTPSGNKSYLDSIMQSYDKLGESFTDSMVAKVQQNITENFDYNIYATGVLSPYQLFCNILYCALSVNAFNAIQEFEKGVHNNVREDILQMISKVYDETSRGLIRSCIDDSDSDYIPSNVPNLGVCQTLPKNKQIMRQLLDSDEYITRALNLNTLKLNGSGDINEYFKSVKDSLIEDYSDMFGDLVEDVNDSPSKKNASDIQLYLTDLQNYIVSNLSTFTVDLSQILNTSLSSDMVGLSAKSGCAATGTTFQERNVLDVDSFCCNGYSSGYSNVSVENQSFYCL